MRLRERIPCVCPPPKVPVPGPVPALVQYSTVSAMLPAYTVMLQYVLRILVLCAVLVLYATVCVQYGGTEQCVQYVQCCAKCSATMCRAVTALCRRASHAPDYMRREGEKR